MDWFQSLLTFAGVIIGSGLIQFLITRKDNRKEELKRIQKELKQGLDEREATGKARYLEHKEAIDKLNEAIFQLTKNDTEQSKYIRYIGDELMGLAHDKLVYLTSHYQKRGAITLKEIATLKAIYEPYHNGLHGNGDGQAGYEFAMTLPVVTDAQAEKMDIEIKKERYKEEFNK